jgi:nitrite reductase/ring-hydroxylating ferredoxin subunit
MAAGIAPSAAWSMPVGFTSPVGSTNEEKSYAIPPVDGAQIDKDNDAILVRSQGNVYVFARACPHQNTALRWESKDNEFECPKHHSKYRPDGTFIEGRATRGMDRFAVRRDGANVVADLDKLYQQDHDADAWKTAFITV